jgi:HEAT repeat protein
MVTPAMPSPRPTPAVLAYGPNGEIYIPRGEIEAIRAHAEEFRSHSEIMRIDAESVREMAAHAREIAHIDEGFYTPMPALAPMPAMPPMPAMTALAPLAAMTPMPAMAYGFNDRFERQVPPAPWAQGDPADSLYRLARGVVDRGDWGRAARLFADLQKNYARSSYAADAQYWEAYSRYKIGTTEELRAAARILEPVASKLTPSNTNRGFYSEGRRTASDNEILSLYARVNGALAQRGDSDAAAKVKRYAQMPGAPCDNEDQQVQSEALNALSQIDPAEATKVLRKVIERKDECSASLRRSAVFMLGRRGDAESASILLTVARSDPSLSVRTEAISFLGRMSGDAGINALEEMLKSDQDERVQRAAVNALMRSENAGARSRMRALIDRKDAPMNLRIEAINSFNSERATDQDVAYLKGLFGKAESDQMKNAIVNTVSRIGGSDNDQWILGIVRDKDESSSVRSNALSRFANRANSISTGDLVKLYDSAGEWYDIRSRLISIMGQRKDQESTDKLIDIVKNSTVINHRTQAINALTNKKDPRATQLLMDILDGKKP